jgi:serine/threonine-protein kinase RsbW
LGADRHAADGLIADLRFIAEPFAVREALCTAISRLGTNIGSGDADMLQLVLAEVLNNIVEHAYAGRPAGDVRMTVRRDRGSIACLIEDQGREMPDLHLPAGRMPDADVPLCELAEGGWGWALIRDLTTHLTYERAGNSNRLSFRMPLAPDRAGET